MSPVFAIIVAVAWFVLGTFLLALAMRAYAIRLRITLPVRKVIGMDDYQDIFSTLTRLSTTLGPKKGRLTKKFKSRLLRWLMQKKIGYVLFSRPPTFNATRVHLPYAYSNLSEVSRRRFRNDPDLLKYLKEIFVQLNWAVFRNQILLYCHYLAEYYRLMRFADRKPYAADPGFEPFDKALTLDLEKIHGALKDADVFGAYKLLLRWGRDDKFSRLSDPELLTVSYLSARLESMVQGAEYLESGEDTKNILEDLCERIRIISTAAGRGQVALFLSAIG